MSTRPVNALALLASSLALFSVLDNIDQIGTGYWFAGLAFGLVVVIAWRRERRIGVWLFAGAMLLWAARLSVADATSAKSLALTSGACAGMLLALAAAHLVNVLSKAND